MTSGHEVGIGIATRVFTPFDEAIDWARNQGFVLIRLIPGFTDGRTGQMLQADGVFFHD